MTSTEQIISAFNRLERKVNKALTPVQPKVFLTPNQIHEKYGISPESLRKHRTGIHKDQFTKEWVRNINGRKHTYEQVAFENFIYNTLAK